MAFKKNKMHIFEDVQNIHRDEEYITNAKNRFFQLKTTKLILAILN